MQEYQLAFIELALAREALRFGQFRLKSGRDSPYFFNAGLFSDGEAASVLGRCYAAAVVRSGLEFDMIFGPAYKGIPLATATAIGLAAHYGQSVPYAYNRKEAKEHGEGGLVVGAPLELIRRAGAEPVGVALALDREERGQGELSAVQELERTEGLKCVSIVTLSDLIEALTAPSGGVPRISAEQLTQLRAYRERYGVR